MGESMKKIVIAGININQGGALSILKDCLYYLKNNLSYRYEIVALVNNKNLFNSLETMVKGNIIERIHNIAYKKFDKVI